MLLFCSNALQAKLGWKCEKHPAPTDPLDSWYAHLVTVGRRNVVVVVLLQFRFIILISGVKGKLWDNLEDIIRQRIREALAACDIPQSVLDNYLPADATFEKCGSADPGDRAKLSSVVKQVRQWMSGQFDAQQLQNAINGYRSYAGGDKVDYGVPSREVRQALLQRYSMPIPAMELECSLDLVRYEARRTLIVPAASTFRALHNCLQVAYRWHDCHLHEFTLPPNDHRELLTRVEVEDPDDLAGQFASMWGFGPDNEDGGEDDPGEKSCKDHETRLQDLLQEGDIFQYLYDFGDSWEILCKVTRFIPDYQGTMPTCTLLEGKAPPEDVGGVPGYLDFMDIIADPNHPEYQDMMDWVDQRWLYDPSKETINMHLHARDFCMQ